MATMCTFTYKHHGLPHLKCVLRFCDKCPSIFLPSQEANKDTTNMCPTIKFHVYQNVSNFTFHGRRQYHEQITWSLCSTVTSSDRAAKVYTRKDLVIL